MTNSMKLTMTSRAFIAFLLLMTLPSIGLANLDKKLTKAVKEGDHELISQLLSEGANPAYFHKRSGGPITEAICRNDTQALTLLKDGGWNIDQDEVTIAGTALGLALSLVNTDVIEWLAINGADGNAQTTTHLIDKFKYGPKIESPQKIYPISLVVIPRPQKIHKLCTDNPPFRAETNQQLFEIYTKRYIALSLLKPDYSKPINYLGYTYNTDEYHTKVVVKPDDGYAYLQALYHPFFSGNLDQIFTALNANGTPLPKSEAGQFILLRGIIGGYRAAESSGFRTQHVETLQWLINELQPDLSSDNSHLDASINNSAVASDISIGNAYRHEDSELYPLATYLGWPALWIDVEAKSGPLHESLNKKLKILVAAGANYEQVDSYGKTPLQHLKEHAPFVYKIVDPVWQKEKGKSQQQLQTNIAQMLPPPIQRDKHLLKIDKLMGSGRYAEALPYFDRLYNLGLPLDSDVTFYHGKALYYSGNYADAQTRFKLYIGDVGREGTHYLKALEYITKSQAQ